MKKILLTFAMLTLLVVGFNQASANAESKKPNSCEADSGECGSSTYWVF